MAEDTLRRVMAEPEAVPVSFNPLRLPYNAVKDVLQSLMSLPEYAKNLYEGAQAGREGEPINYAPYLGAATMTMGATPFSAPRGAIGGGPVYHGNPRSGITLGSGPTDKRLGAALMTPGIRAYHGSPYDFDRFDLSKIGTGEGAQAYGHGLYFAENPEVAASYKENMTHTSQGAVGYARRLLGYENGNVDAAIARFNRQANTSEGRLYPEALDYLKMVKEGGMIPNLNPGRMYEVNINADPAHLLDWDRPLSQQPSHVRKAIDPLVEDVLRAGRSGIDAETAAQFPILADIRSKWAMQPPTTGGELIPRLGGGPSASAALSEAGVPGIKYLDQGSRGAGAGTSNYVIFDDKLIDILRKYGLAGASPLAALMASGGEQPQQ